MRTRIAEVDSERLGAVLVANPQQVLGGFGERLVPRNFLPVGAGAANRAAKPVSVVLQFLQRMRFRADVATAEGVFGVSPHRQHLSTLGLHHDAARCLAERTRTIRSSHHGVTYQT